MTNTDKESERKSPEGLEKSLLEEVGHRVRYIQRKVNEIASQVEDNYHVLRDLLDSTTHENGNSWHDLYGEDEEYA